MNLENCTVVNIRYVVSILVALHWGWLPWQGTPSNSEIICGQNVSTKVVCGIFLFFEKKAMLKI